MNLNNQSSLHNPHGLDNQPKKIQTGKTGVLLINLGSPDAPTPWGVMKFLRSFLSDTRVIEIPKWLWRFILYGLVLPFRSFKVAKHYQHIWTKTGSPLRVQTDALATRLSQYLSEKQGQPISVLSAMTYGNPSLQNALSIFMSQAVTRLIVLPIFPFYSATTSAAAFDALAKQLATMRSIPSLFFIRDYGMEACYIQAIAESILEHWQVHGRAERLLFSFHGIPLRYQQLGDPYGNLCQTAAKAVAKRLNLPENSWEISYQSRFGFNAWLMPSTDQTLVALAQSGIESVDVVSPSFSVECLETIQELGDQSRRIFLSAGGKSFRYIPTLNDSDRHVWLLGQLIENFF